MLGHVFVVRIYLRVCCHLKAFQRSTMRYTLNKSQKLARVKTCYDAPCCVFYGENKENGVNSRLWILHPSDTAPSSVGHRCSAVELLREPHYYLLLKYNVYCYDLKFDKWFVL